MMSCFHGNTISQVAPLVPALLKALDKAIAQPTQAPSVTEGLCAACLLLKFVSATGEKDRLQNHWNAILDMDKQLFVSEKFLSLTTEDGELFFFNSSRRSFRVL